MYVYSYKSASANGRLLAEALEVPRIKHANSNFKGDINTTVVNWGSSDLPRAVRRCNVLNGEDAVDTAIHKLEALEAMRDAGVPTVEFTSDFNTAFRWYNEGATVYERHSLTGHDGAGIGVARPSDANGNLDRAPLYTKGITAARDEYRIMVAFGEVIAVQKKVRANDFAGDANQDVRTTDGGWGFKLLLTDRAYQRVKDAAVAATEALGLDFAGVDIIRTHADGLAHVLEVNTAPELTATTCLRLARAITAHHQRAEAN